MLFEIYLWTVSFLLLYISVFWLIVSSLHKKKHTSFDGEYPFISLAVPAHNEEEGIIGTLDSLSQLDYPKNKFEILVIDDASTDSTAEKVRSFSSHSSVPVVLIHRRTNKGKAAGLNAALKLSKGEYFGVVDADSLVSSTCLKAMLPYFEKNVGAVISSISVHRSKTIVEKIQRFEYILASFMRHLMSSVDTLHTTPGVLSLYKTSVLRSLKGFDEGNLTEDYEIAMRLRYHHYDVKMCPYSITYTSVPEHMRGLWYQRVRWFRGFISNNLLYRKMFLSKRHGLMGMFQMPLNVFVLVVVFLSLGFVSYQAFRLLRQIIYRLQIMEWSFLSSFPYHSLRELIFAFDFKLHFPFLLLFISGIYLYVKAHRFSSEHWKFHFATFIYLFLYPFVRSLQWLHALLLELFGARKKW